MLMAMFACQCSSPDAGIGPQLKIIYPAGTTPDTTWNYLPYPAHYGVMDGKNILLLSKAPKIGATRSINPVAEFVTIENGATSHWIVANDLHKDYKIKGLNDVNDLMTNHNGIKSTLERWILNRKGIGQVQLKGWKETPSFNQSNNQ